MKLTNETWKPTPGNRERPEFLWRELFPVEDQDGKKEI